MSTKKYKKGKKQTGLKLFKPEMKHLHMHYLHMRVFLTHGQNMTG